MGEYKVIMSPGAINDLKSVKRYIAVELSAPETAENYINSIMESIMSLSELPHRIKFVDEEPFHSEGLRKMTVKRFYVYFTVDGENMIVNVLYIIYSRRDQLGFLSK